MILKVDIDENLKRLIETKASENNLTQSQLINSILRNYEREEIILEDFGNKTEIFKDLEKQVQQILDVELEKMKNKLRDLITLS